MNGRPHERALHDGPALECPRQGVALEALERDHSPTYIDGAYWAWMPPIRSSALSSEARLRASRN